MTNKILSHAKGVLAAAGYQCFPYVGGYLAALGTNELGPLPGIIVAAHETRFDLSYGVHEAAVEAYIERYERAGYERVASGSMTQFERKNRLVRLTFQSHAKCNQALPDETSLDFIGDEIGIALSQSRIVVQNTNIYDCLLRFEPPSWAADARANMWIRHIVAHRVLGRPFFSYEEVLLACAPMSQQERWKLDDFNRWLGQQPAE